MENKKLSMDIIRATRELDDVVLVYGNLITAMQVEIERLESIIKKLENEVNKHRK